MRIKRPDQKNALSIIEAAKREIEFTLSLEITEKAGSTIVRNIYECFRMLGDALLISEGIESIDHILPINRLLKINISTARPINIIDNLRRLRHNINYYGYRPNLMEIKETVSIARTIFEPLFNAVLKEIKSKTK